MPLPRSNLNNGHRGFLNNFLNKMGACFLEGNCFKI